MEEASISLNGFDFTVTFPKKCEAKDAYLTIEAMGADKMYEIRITTATSQMLHDLVKGDVSLVIALLLNWFDSEEPDMKIEGDRLVLYPTIDVLNKQIKVPISMASKPITATEVATHQYRKLNAQMTEFMERLDALESNAERNVQFNDQEEIIELKDEEPIEEEEEKVKQEKPKKKKGKKDKKDKKKKKNYLED